jgi:excisionase family DNA binding protein
MSPDQLATKADISRLTDLLTKLRQELKIHKQEPQKGDRIFTRQQLAEYYEISLSTVDKLTRDGIFPSFRIGGNVRYRESEILKANEVLRGQRPTFGKKMSRNIS